MPSTDVVDEITARSWFSRPTAVRLLVSLGAVAAVVTSAAPAQADSLTDSFLAALNNAGVPYGDPPDAVSLGQSVCPMLAQPGGTFARAASNVTGHSGMSADMAGMFTSIAISMYCPSMVSSIADGSWADGLPLSGLGIPGLDIPGFSG